MTSQTAAARLEMWRTAATETATRNARGAGRRKPAGAAAAPSPEAATPHDIERIIQRRAERAERVWAH
jgi:hypothetical protein